MRTDRTTPFRRGLALAAWLAAMAPAAALAAMADYDPFAAMEPLGRSALGELRGGMMIGGIPVDFAVVIRTTVEGAMAPMALQTVLKVDDAGGIGSTTTSATGGGTAMTGAETDGFSMSYGNGATSILHQVIKDQVQAMITNAQDNVSISHATSVDVTMPGFTQLSQNHASQAQVSRLGYEAAVVGLGRY